MKRDKALQELAKTLTSRRDLPRADVVTLATNEYERLLSRIDRTNGGTIRCLTLRCTTLGT